MTIRRRAYQTLSLQLSRKHRVIVRFWARQSGKTTTGAEDAILEMMERPGHVITFATGTLLLGREMIMKEAATLKESIDAYLKTPNVHLEIHDQEHGDQDLTDQLTTDDFADIFEHKRLEFWLWHDNTTASRTQVIAPSVATARGWSATVQLDEIGHINDFRELFGAIEPIISTNPDFRLIMSGTPPEDDGHLSFDLFSPVTPMQFEPNVLGHQYRNEFGIPVHRVDIDDAYAAGRKIYSLVDGIEITPDEHREQSVNREAWDRNYRLKLKNVGANACSTEDLKAAQSAGAKQCYATEIDSNFDLARAANRLKELVGAGDLALGYDVATTEKAVSNPSALSVVERVDSTFVVRLIVRWKTSDPDWSREIIRTIAKAVIRRPEGRRPKGLAIDGSNERFYATDFKKEIADLMPCQIVIAGEKAPYKGEEMNFKEYCGSLVVNALEDRQIALPPDRWIRDDFRLVMKERGRFQNLLDTEGNHGDTFDGTKLALLLLKPARVDYVSALI